MTNFNLSVLENSPTVDNTFRRLGTVNLYLTLNKRVKPHYYVEVVVVLLYNEIQKHNIDNHYYDNVSEAAFLQYKYYYLLVFQPLQSVTSCRLFLCCCLPI